jgi:hypothetical protein
MFPVFLYIKYMEKFYYGFRWNNQSCWMDASLMALFFPDEMYKKMFYYLRKTKSDDNDVNEVKEITKKLVNKMRSPGIIPDVIQLRDFLWKHWHNKTKHQNYAFQPEHEQGYVFYFIQEFLELMSFPVLRARPTHGQDWQETRILEIENCEGNTLEECLHINFNHWKFDKKSLNYLIIELVNHTVIPQETLHFEGIVWKLHSMIVFDCSHFVTYIKKNDKWFIYDDNRALNEQPLKKNTFGNYYETGLCNFKYGLKNTFFFLLPQT